MHNFQWCLTTTYQTKSDKWGPASGKLDNPNLIPRTHIKVLGKNWLYSSDLHTCMAHICLHSHVHTPWLMINKNIFKLKLSVLEIETNLPCNGSNMNETASGSSWSGSSWIWINMVIVGSPLLLLLQSFTHHFLAAIFVENQGN